MKITYTTVQADVEGRLHPSDFVQALTPKTRLVVCTHASNVCGNVYDIDAIRQAVQRKGVYFMVDAAQSAGILNIDASKLDLFAFPGHKGLYGPQGSGGLYVAEGITLSPLTEGGTGSQSELLLQPEEMPDRLESGTLNVPAICGLGAGVDFILKEGTGTIFEYEKYLTQYFTNKIRNIPGLTIYGSKNRLGIVALNLNVMDCTTAAGVLNEDYNIAVRSGLHCAPLAHKTLSTQKGCIRFSFGYYTQKKELDRAVFALNQLAKRNV